MGTQNVSFEVHPSVIFKLGEELITDDYQALSELTKNCYDADASRAKISINSDRYYKVNRGTIVECSKNDEGALLGIIRIEDDGCGMSEDDIRQGWLTISSSKKREMKKRGYRTEKGRTPLGDKGLGRLGTQRLGPVLRMSTKTKSGQALVALIDWRRFQSDNPLSTILIPIQEDDSFKR
ncbi:MAG: ATP-binding protein, partial [Eggerthella sp.]|nr:ATP-binding protein [Eggerthella sp.]